MAHINAYITFGTNTREAMTFYQQCLGGELNIMNAGDAPSSEPMPDEMKDMVMHACLNDGKFNIMASDNMMPGDGPVVGNNISLMIAPESEEETRSLFDKLGEDGTVTQPLMDSFWGSIYGQLTDKFGINWMFNYEKPQSA